MRIEPGKFWQRIIQLIVCCSVIKPAAGQSPDEIFRPKAPAITDTIYYPFYQGVQMIEVDNIGFWDKHIFYLEQTKPRALSYSMIEPPPSPNVYLFRNSAGVIIKAFNTTSSLAALNAHFKKIPVFQKTRHMMHRLMPFHNGKAAFSRGAWPYSPNGQFFFNGFYKVYDMKTPVTGRGRGRVLDITNQSGPVGLIDSLGNLRMEMQYQQIFPAGNDLFVMKDNKWGVMDKKGNTILPLEYDGFKYEKDSVVVFQKKEKLTLLYFPNTRRNIPLDDFDDIYMDFLEENRFVAVFRNGKTGLMNAQYQIVTPPIYDICEYYVDAKKNPGRVSANNKWGFLDPLTGKLVIPCRYEHAEPFTEEGIALVQQDGKWQCIDTKGNTLPDCNLKPNWEKEKAIPKTDSWIVKQRQRYGVINKDNQVVVPLIYTYMYTRDKEDILRVKQNNKKHGLLNLNGEELLPCIYDEIKDFSSNGLAIIVKDTLMGLIDKQCRVIAPCVYTSFFYTYHNLMVFSKDGKEGVLDNKGKIFIPAVYDNIRGFNEAGYAQVMKDSLYGIIDLQQQEIVPIKYKTLSSEFINNRVWFGQNKKIGFLAAGGVVAIPAVYEYANNFDQPITSVRKGNNWAFIDTSGKQRTDFIYESVDHFWMGFKYCRVRKAGKWGIIDTNATEILPCIYDEINGYSGKYGFPVRKGKESFNIYPSGERVIR